MYPWRGTYWLGRKYLPLVEALWSSSWANIPRPPEKLTVARGPGPDPDRILLTGGSSAVGWGVISHDLGLAGHLVRQIVTLTGRGMDVEVVAGPAVTVQTVTAYLTPHAIARYDAIVLTLGTREAFEFMPVDTWSSLLGTLLDQISAGTSEPPSVLVVGAEERSPVPLPKWFKAIVLRRARLLNEASRTVVAGRDRVKYVDSAMVPEAEGDGLFEAVYSRLYTKAAQAIVPLLASLLHEGHDGQVRPIDEDRRRDALQHLRSFDGDTTRVTDLLLRLQRMLGVRSVDLYLVDHDLVTTLASTSQAPPARERKSTISTMALEYRNGFLVPDTLLDPRFASLPEVTGAPYLRFYAAYPVEAPDGNRVALLSMVHDEPLDLLPRDLELMRSFAIRVSAVLFEGY